MTLHARHCAAARALLAGRPVPVALARPALLLLIGKAEQLRRLGRPVDARNGYRALCAWAATQAAEVER